MKLTQRLQLVRSPQDRYELSVAERRYVPVSKPTVKQVQFYRDRLKVLADVMSGAPFPWYLEGGHVLPLRTGKFVRQHADIDMGFYRHDLGSAIDFFKGKGYEFFYRNYHFAPLENIPWDLFEKTSAEQIAKRALKRLYVMKTKRGGEIDEGETRVREIDLHLHEKNGQSVYVAKQRFSVPVTWFEDVFSYQENGVPAIPVGSLKLFYFFKLGGRRPRHVHDRHTIERTGLLSPEEVSEVKSVRQ